MDAGQGRTAGASAHVFGAEGLIAAHSDHMRFVKDERDFGETVNWMGKRVPPELRWNGPVGVRVAHQREPGREMIMLANPSALDAEGELVCGFGGSVSIWNPETGKIQDAGTKASGQAISVAVPADSARFVVFENSE